MTRSWLRPTRWLTPVAFAGASLLCAADSGAANPSNVWISAMTSYPSSTCLYDAAGHFVYAFGTAYASPITFLGPPTGPAALQFLLCNAVGTIAPGISFCNNTTSANVGQIWAMLGYFQNDSSGYPFHADSSSGTEYPNSVTTTVLGFPAGGVASGPSCGTITGSVWVTENPRP